MSNYLPESSPQLIKRNEKRLNVLERRANPAGKLTDLDGRVISLDGRVGLLETRSQGVIPSSIVVGSGSASAAADGTITITGCSSVSLNDIFDSLGMGMYDFYFSGITSVDLLAILGRFRAAGTDLSAANSYGAYFNGIVSAASSVGGTAGKTLNSMYFGWGRNSLALNGSAKGHIVSPAVSGVGSTLTTDIYTPNYLRYTMASYTDTTSVYDGLTLFVTSGMFDGKLKIVRV